MKIEGAIFDFDGTLYDSMGIWEEVGSIYLKSQGKNPEKNLNRKIKNMSLEQSAEYFNKKYNLNKTKKQIINEINEQIKTAYREKIEPKKGAAEFLEKLKNLKIKMIIATATDKFLIEKALKRNKLDIYFLDIITCNIVGKGKDNPLIYYKAMEKLKTKKETTLIFEDSYFASKTAKDSGFLVCGIYDKYENKKRELKMISDYYLENFMGNINLK